MYCLDNAILLPNSLLVKYILVQLTNKHLHCCQGVVLPVDVLHFVLCALLGGWADGIELVPFFNELLCRRVRQLEGLAGQCAVQSKWTQNHCRENKRRDLHSMYSTEQEILGICGIKGKNLGHRPVTII